MSPSRGGGEEYMLFTTVSFFSFFFFIIQGTKIWKKIYANTIRDKLSPVGGQNLKIFFHTGKSEWVGPCCSAYLLSDLCSKFRILLSENIISKSIGRATLIFFRIQTFCREWYLIQTMTRISKKNYYWYRIMYTLSLYIENCCCLYFSRMIISKRV